MSTENINLSDDSIIKKSKQSPVLKLGKYKGLRVSQISNRQYLEWIITQDFGEDYVQSAKDKLKVLKKTTDVKIEITRHAYDQFSLRHMELWTGKVGIGTFVSELADEAWRFGKDISTRKNKTDKIILYQDIKFVFNREKDYKVCITIM